MLASELFNRLEKFVIIVKDSLRKLQKRLLSHSNYKVRQKLRNKRRHSANTLQSNTSRLALGGGLNYLFSTESLQRLQFGKLEGSTKCHWQKNSALQLLKQNKLSCLKNWTSLNKELRKIRKTQEMH